MSSINYLLWVQGFLGAGLASLGFGVLFNVRGKNLLLAGFTGAIGGMIYEYCSSCSWPEGLSCFVAALVIGILGEIFARLQKTMMTTFTACALIPLVPGGTAYEMMVDFATGQIAQGASRAVDLLSISGMLAIAIIIISTLTRFFFYSKRKAVGAAKKIVQVEQSIRTNGFPSPTRLQERKNSLPVRKARRSHPDTVLDDPVPLREESILLLRPCVHTESAAPDSDQSHPDHTDPDENHSNQ